MKTLATDLLDAHANALPFQQPLRKTLMHTPTYSLFNSYYARQITPSTEESAQRTTHASDINPHDTETITPIRHYSKWEPDITTQVAQSPEEAIIEDTIAQEGLRVYSDGPAVDGGVGGAAVLMRGDVVVREKRFHLGSGEKHTVYERELVGMILMIDLLREEGGKGTLVLSVDNQVEIKATRAFNSTAGHYLMDILHDDLPRLIPAHDQRKLIV
ncbi:hypothetical protein AZE42_10755 [Rhizopogon vesiculosus]|uniref:RNase H type-1 domain-containing protein n=1 Tax=Rhizopogon vesiculosus TaxID=180088 RepID=A0A1J8PY96_9AGAM|nr:hypothetical protein AZE42_10755 [Rhizopogon vesiculosus]